MIDKDIFLDQIQYYKNLTTDYFGKIKYVAIATMKN
jgi:hypothetical protein